MASTLNEGSITLVYSGHKTFVLTLSTDVTANFVAYTTETLDDSPINTLYGPPVETLTESYSVNDEGPPVPPASAPEPTTSTPPASIHPASSSPTTNTNSTFDPPTSTSTASAGLSSGAKADIGAGVAVTFLIVAAFVTGCLIVRRRRRRQSPLSEVVSPAQEAGYHKPELDATEIPRPSDRGPGGGRPEKPELEANLAQQSHVGVQDHRVELDGAPKPRTDGRAELDGRMVSNNGKIT